MIENIELSNKQREFFDLFDERLQTHQSCIISSKERQWGKTSIVNEIGFTYQALGYQVLFLTKFPNSNEHFATKYISCDFDLYGIDRRRCVAIIDEYDIRNDRDFDLWNLICNYNIPCVGFWN